MAQKSLDNIPVPIHTGIKHALRIHDSRAKGRTGNQLTPWLVSAPGAGKTEMIRHFGQKMGLTVKAFEPGLERPEKFGGIPDIFRIRKDEKFVLEDFGFSMSEILAEVSRKSSPNYKEPTQKKKPIDGALRPLDDYSLQELSTMATKTLKAEEIHRRNDHSGELVTEWSVPELIHTLRRASENNPRGVICLLDDWHLADESIQAIGFELFTHYSLNGHAVPNNVSFILAGNDSSMAGAKLQFSAVRNRSCLYHCVPDLDFWLTSFAILKGVHETVCGFFSDINNKGFFHTEESTTEQFASPRSWTQGVSANLIDLERLQVEKGRTLDDIDSRELTAIVQGCVDKKSAKTFMEFFIYYRKIDFTSLFEKGIVKIPTKPMHRFAYATAISNEIYRICATDPKNKYAVKYYAKAIEQMVDENKELAIKGLYQICQKQEDKELGLPSGSDILKVMAETGGIPLKLLQRLPKVTEVMKRGR